MKFILLIMLIFCILTLIGCIFELIEWYKKVNNWKTLKQASDEYFDCLMLRLISGLGIFVCGFDIAIIICLFVSIV